MKVIFTTVTYFPFLEGTYPTLPPYVRPPPGKDL